MYRERAYTQIGVCHAYRRRGTQTRRCGMYTGRRCGMCTGARHAYKEQYKRNWFDDPLPNTIDL